MNDNAPRSTTPDFDSAPARGLSRRQVVKAGAWAAPAVVLATATPAFAGSIGTVSVTAMQGTISGQGNNHSHVVSVTIVNNSSASIAVTANFTTGGGGITTPSPSSATKTLTANEVWIISGISFSTTNNGGKTFSVALPASSTSWTFTGASDSFNGNTAVSYP